MINKEQPRRKFLHTGVVGCCVAVLSCLPKIGIGKHLGGNQKGMVIHENEGTHILTGRRRVPMNIKISKAKHGVDNISFCTEEIIPGRTLRIHKHLYNDELIFIHKGEGVITVGDQCVEVKSGAVVFVPRGVWHGLKNTGKENICMIFQYSPAGFEEYFIENGTPEGMAPKERTEAEYASAELKYGMVYKEPR